MTPDQQDAIVQLRSLLVEEENLYVGSDERTLVMYLNLTDYDVEGAFERIKKFYKTKLEFRDWFAHTRDPEVHDQILKLGVHQMLDYRDQLGRRIYILKLGNMVYGEWEPPEMFSVDDLWGALAADEEETQKNGIVVIGDFSGMNWRFLKYYSPKYIRAATRKLENIPFKHYEFHCLNAGIVLNTLVSLVFPFLCQAIKDRLHFHKSLQSLHAHISPSSLPVEYGGTRPPVDSQKLVHEYLDARNERLSELLSYGYRTDKDGPQ